MALTSRSDLVRERNFIQDEMAGMFKYMKPSAFDSNTKREAQSRFNRMVTEVYDLNRRIAQFNMYKPKKYTIFKRKRT